jgi:di/tricarboxylate transporter
MTTDQIILFALFGLVFAFLLWGKFRYDIVAFSALMAGVLLGVVPTSQAFAGFGHPATLVVALVLVVSAGLVRSGAVFLITRTLVNASRSLGSHITLMGAIGGVLSALMNNVAALALLMPVDIQTARKAGRSPGLSLMPLSFATILGGMVTLIGTPPNIIIASIREERLGAPFAMFDFAPVGGVTAIAGLIFIALIGWRLIPAREDSKLGADDISQFIAELTVPEGSRLIGKQLRDLEEEAEKADVAIIGLIRDSKRRYGRARDARLRAGDALVLEATPDALDEFRAAFSLAVADAKREERLKADGDGVDVIEVVVTDQSRLIGRTAQSVGLGWRQSTVLLGISHRGQKITRQIRKTQINVGDILLLLVPRETGADVTQWLGCLPLADRGLAVTADEKVWIAIGIFSAAVLAASVGLIYLPVALGLVVVVYVLAKIVPLAELYTHIE